MDLSRHGDWLAMASGKPVTVYETGPGQPAAQWTCRATVNDLSISADGTHVAVSLSHPTIDVYNVKRGAVSARLDRAGGPDFLHNDPQEHLAFYPNGKKVISTGTRRRMYVSDAVTGKWDYIMLINLSGSVECAVAPDGNHVALFGQPNRERLTGHVAMYRVNRGLQPLWTKWHDGKDRIRCGVFSPNSQRFATCGSGDGIRIWDVKTGDLARHLEPANAPRDVAFCGSRHLASASGSHIDLFQIDTSKRIRRQDVDMPISRLVGSADGSILATHGTSAAIDIWSVTPDPD